MEQFVVILVLCSTAIVSVVSVLFYLAYKDRQKKRHRINVDKVKRDIKKNIDKLRGKKAMEQAEDELLSDEIIELSIKEMMRRKELNDTIDNGKN
jgi:hypothetical protein